MSKTLSNILTVFKVAKVIAKVVLILCIIGASGSLLALTMLPLLQGVFSDRFLAEMGLDIVSSYAECIVGLIACVGEIVLACLAGRYFKNVLAAGTPFTFDGAKECFRFGIASIIVSGATSILSGMALAISSLASMGVSNINVNVSISFAPGLFFLFLSLIFKHAAEISAPKAEEPHQEGSSTETETL